MGKKNFLIHRKKEKKWLVGKIWLNPKSFPRTELTPRKNKPCRKYPYLKKEKRQPSICAGRIIGKFTKVWKFEMVGRNCFSKGGMSREEARIRIDWKKGGV